jgi:hypothetical protein
MGEYLETVDRYMRLALKAQRQCRAMLKCLAETKNPAPLAIGKQATNSYLLPKYRIIIASEVRFLSSLHHKN